MKCFHQYMPATHPCDAGIEVIRMLHQEKLQDHCLGLPAGAGIMPQKGTISTISRMTIFRVFDVESGLIEATDSLIFHDFPMTFCS